MNEQGTKEVKGQKDNPKIVQYFADVGHSWVKDDETAWCAAFVGSCLEKAGLTSTRALNARSYLKWGRKISKPVVGCVVIFVVESRCLGKSACSYLYNWRTRKNKPDMKTRMRNHLFGI